VLTWGRCDYGQLGREVPHPPSGGVLQYDPVPTEVPSLAGVRQVSRSASRGFVGSTMCVCRWSVAQSTAWPLQVCDLPRALHVYRPSAVGDSAGDGSVVAFGWNEHGQCGVGNEVDVKGMAKTVFPGSSVRGLLIGTGAGHSLALVSSQPLAPATPSDNENSSC